MIIGEKDGGTGIAHRLAPSPCDLARNNMDAEPRKYYGYGVYFSSYSTAPSCQFLDSNVV